MPCLDVGLTDTSPILRVQPSGVRGEVLLSMGYYDKVIDMTIDRTETLELRDHLTELLKHMPEDKES